MYSDIGLCVHVTCKSIMVCVSEDRILNNWSLGLKTVLKFCYNGEICETAAEVSVLKKVSGPKRNNCLQVKTV